MRQSEMPLNFHLINNGNNCFAQLPDKILSELAQHKSQVDYKKGDMIIKQSAFPAGVIFIISGLVKEYIEGPNGKNKNLRILTPGNFLALSGLFNNGTNNFSASALSDVSACVIERDFLVGLIQSNAELSFNLVKRYAELENSFFKLLHNSLYKQMNGKVADTLLYLSAPELMEENVFEYLFRKDIAEFASVTTENVIRVLKNFEQEGIIALENKHIRIVDKGELERISKIG